METAVKKSSWTSKILALEVGQSIPTVQYEKQHTIRTLVSHTIRMMAPDRLFKCKKNGDTLNVERIK